MPLDKFEGKLSVRTRNQIRDNALRDWKLRQPGADTGPKTQPHVECTNLADALLPLESNITILGDATTFLNARGKLLEEWGEALGRERQGQSGAVGFVTCTTAIGGSSVVGGDECREPKQGTRFRAIVSGSVANGGQVGIQGITAGPSTNLEPGTILEWSNPRPGMATRCVVFANADGSGLTGGANEETDEEYSRALLTLSQNPPAMGNEAETLEAISKIRGLAIQQGFVVPAVAGPGTKTVMITMRPASPGGSRLPNNAHLTLLEAELKAIFPADDGIIAASMLEHGFAVVMKVSWKEAASSFVDQSPWPAYYSPTVKVSNAVAISPTAFRVTSAAVVDAPSVGKTIALYNPVARAFVAKRIKTVTQISATHTWDLTFETTIPTSDTTYAPSNGQIVSPWAESMQDVVLPVLNYVDVQGPGELFASFDDPGRRRRRVPESAPDSWPSRIENRMLDPIFSVVSDAVVVEPAVPFATTVGTPPALAYLHRCTDIAIYPF